jgi:hypothetical protein
VFSTPRLDLWWYQTLKLYIDKTEGYYRFKTFIRWSSSNFSP